MNTTRNRLYQIASAYSSEKEKTGWSAHAYYMRMCEERKKYADRPRYGERRTKGWGKRGCCRIKKEKKVERRKETGKRLVRFCSVGSIALSRIVLFSMYICTRCIPAPDAACTCKHIHVVTAAVVHRAECKVRHSVIARNVSCSLPVKEGCGHPLHLRDFSHCRDVLKFTDEKEKMLVRRALPTIYYFCTKRFR